MFELSLNQSFENNIHQAALDQVAHEKVNLFVVEPLLISFTALGHGTLPHDVFLQEVHISKVAYHKLQLEELDVSDNQKFQVIVISDEEIVFNPEAFTFTQFVWFGNTIFQAFEPVQVLAGFVIQDNDIDEFITHA